MQKDLYQHPDYFLVDELLTDEHKLIRDSVRAYVKKDISPIIEEYAQKAEFPHQIIKGMGDLGCFGPFVPQKYGGAGLDYISYAATRACVLQPLFRVLSLCSLSTNSVARSKR